MTIPDKGLIGLVVLFSHPDKCFLSESCLKEAKALDLKYASVILKESGDEVNAHVSISSKTHGKVKYIYPVDEAFFEAGARDKRSAYLSILLIRGIDDAYTARLRQHKPKDAVEALTGDFLPTARSQ